MTETALDIFGDAAALPDAAQRKEIAALLVGKRLWLFPIAADGTKKPAHRGWQQEATRDLNQIGAWIDAGHSLGIFTGKYGDGEGDGAILAIDIDCGAEHGGKDGHATLASLRSGGFDFSETFTQSTPSGGRHLLYVVPQAVKQDVRGEVLGSGLDLKSRGNYIVAAGSIRKGGAYKIEQDREIATAPAWLYERCAARDVPAPADVHNADPADVDQERAERIFREYLKERAPHAGQGNRNDTVNRYWATWAKHIGLADQYQVASIILEAAPWDGEPLGYDEILRTVASNYQAPGIAFGDWPDGVAPAPPNVEPSFAPIARREILAPRFEDLSESQIAAIDESTDGGFTKVVLLGGKVSLRDAASALLGDYHPLQEIPGLSSGASIALTTKQKWLIEEIVPARTTGLIYGPKSSAKTPLGLSLALHVALGRPYWIDPQFKIERAAPVLYLAIEDPDGVKERFLAALQHLEASSADAWRFYQNDTRINLMPDHAAQAKREIMRRCNRIRLETGEYPALIFLDTKSRATPGAREQTEDTTLVLDLLDDLIAMLDGVPTFIVVHHSPKGDKYTMRGSGTMKDNVNAVIRTDEPAPGRFEFELEYVKGGSKRRMKPTFVVRQYGVGERVRVDKTIEIITSVAVDFCPFEAIAALGDLPAELTQNAIEALAILKDMRAATEKAVSVKDWRRAYFAKRPVADKGNRSRAWKAIYEGLVAAQAISVDGSQRVEPARNGASTFLPQEEGQNSVF